MIALLLAAGLARATIAVEPAPVRGVESVVRVTDDKGRPEVGRTVRVVLRPGLDGEREEAVGITDGRGRVRWTPSSGGVARVQAEEEGLPVSVAWPEIPAETAILLGLVALGSASGLIFGLWPRRHERR